MTRTHGRTGCPEYEVWKGMKQRCSNPNHKSYADYAARGVTVCDRWTRSFENFIADMGPRPSPAYSIERLDNGKGYSPENCRWATKLEQTNNKRNNCIVMFRGEQMTFAEAHRRSGSTLIVQIAGDRYRRGWDLEAALLTGRRFIRRTSQEVR